MESYKSNTEKAHIQAFRKESYIRKLTYQPKPTIVPKGKVQSTKEREKHEIKSLQQQAGFGPRRTAEKTSRQPSRPQVQHQFLEGFRLGSCWQGERPMTPSLEWHPWGLSHPPHPE